MFIAGNVGLVLLKVAPKRDSEAPARDSLASVDLCFEIFCRRVKIEECGGMGSYADNWNEQLEEVIALRAILGSDFRFVSIADASICRG